MQLLRPANALLRVTLAVIFGVMSLAHGPVMAFAKANTPAAVHDMAAGPLAAHHHHPAATQPVSGQQEHPVASAQEDATICHAAGCFTVVAPVLVGAPDSLFSLLGQLRAAPARALLPAILDPLVPPPRLQA
jgi:hypothetical protein